MINTQIFTEFSLVLLLLICLIVSFKLKPSEKGTKSWLMLYFWTNFYGMLVVCIFSIGYGQLFPHLYRTVQIAALLICPFSFFYIQQVLFPRKLQYADLLHLLPVVVFIIDYFPFYLLPGAEKIAVFDRNTVNDLSKMAYAEGWFMPAFGHIIIRYLVILSYTLAQILLINKYNKSKNDKESVSHDIISWIKLLIASQLIYILLPLPFIILSFGKALSDLINVAALISICIQCYYLVFRPQILYGEVETPSKAKMPVVEELEQEQISPKIPIHDIKKVAPVVTYPDEIMKAVGFQLDEHMKIRQPYLIPGYRIKDLSHDTQISVHLLSAYINNYAEVNYSNYINGYRINYFISKLKFDEHSNKTLEALSKDCGFQDRSTFCRAFKNYTGVTVSDYMKKSTYLIETDTH